MALPEGALPAGEFPDIVAAVLEAKRRQIRAYPQHKNRASECGHPCERYLVLSRTRWQEKVLHDPVLQMIFEGGHMIEGMALADLRQAGFQVIEQQRAFEWLALELTGHIDCKIVLDGKAYPLEIKGLNPRDWEALNSVEDMLRSPKPWIRKYPAQLTMYLLNTGGGDIQYAYFYLKNKITFAPKVLRLKLDYDYAESICKRLERVNAHVAAETMPAPCDEPALCSNCGFLHVCLPEVKGQELQIIDDAELQAALERREALAPARAEYEEVDELVKRALKERDKLMIGDYLIMGKWVDRKGYTVADTRYWQTKITRLKPSAARGGDAA